MRNKIFILIFGIALFCVMLFIACENIFEKPEIQKPFEDGYGRISICFAGDEETPQTARTVFPSTVFDKCVYIFTKEGEADGVEINSDNEGFFTLEIGSYTVEVRAYIGNEEPYTLIASGVSLPFSVGPGENDPIEVILNEVYTGDNGEFSYTITYPVGAKTVVRLQRYPALTDVALTPVSLSQEDGISETLELRAGSYLISIYLYKDGFYTGLTEAVHIYSSLTSEFNKNFDNYDLRLAVSYNYDWNAALAFISNGGSGTVENPKAYTIIIDGDVPVLGSTTNTFGDVENVSVTIEGKGKLYLTSQGSLLNIGNNQAVYVNSTDLTIQGIKDGQYGFTYGNNRAVIYLSGGTFSMQGNASVSGNTARFNIVNGGGVYVNGGGVYVDGGTFIMQDSTYVYDNTAGNLGGGVYVNEGTFTMQGNASVSGNTGNLCGGVYVNEGIFTMQDNASVYSNSGSFEVYVTGSDRTFTMRNNVSVSGGVYFASNGSLTMQDSASAGGVSVTGGSLTMQDNASVSGGRVSVREGTFTMQDNVSVSGSSNGGVYVDSDSTFIMQDNASVYGNSANSGGGGVYVGSESIFTMQDNASVSGNTVSGSGGGVYINNGTFNMQDDSKVSENTAANGNGGGVYMNGPSSIFIMNDNALVISNTATSSSGSSYNISGGGVYVNEGTFTMQENATVSYNTVSLTNISRNASYYTYGGGVYVGNGTFTMQNSATVFNNTASLSGISGSNVNYTRTSEGGGVCVATRGIFIMHDSTSVSGNIAKHNDYFNNSGVYSNGIFTMQDHASVSGNTGSGVHSSGTFTMWGYASVSSNTGYGVSGNGTMQDNASVYGNSYSGLYVSGTFTMQGNASVYGNTAYSYGGGVYIDNGTFNMKSNASVFGNTAPNNGGGVYVRRGNFIMQESASVYGNTASNSGGGVYVGEVSYVSNFTMRGGTVYGIDEIGADENGKPLANTSPSGTALYVYTVNNYGNAKYGDDSNILPNSPHDSFSSYTDYTIVGRE